MSNGFLDSIFRSSSVELPVLNTMDDYLDFIISKIRPWSEDLNEQDNYVGENIWWMEIQDSENFHESILHCFKEGGEYLVSVDGNVYQGAWQLLEGTNKMLLQRPVGGVSARELYELSFLNPTFFVLQKHGDQKRKGFKKYFLIVREEAIRGKGLEWRDIMELMFNNYRTDEPSMIIWIVILIVVLAVVARYSLF